MSEIQQYRTASITRGVSRQVGRSLTRIEGNASVDIARVEARADVDTAKVNAGVAVTQQALAGAQYLTHLEMTLAEQTPAAMSRLAQIGTAGNFLLSQIVMDTGTKLRRI
ncbi:hypothetical protein [uncultured Jatrophihabitans sp.]|uniref:hypothetical protein n=1 Tax=uncultured Jatrophihabitans sp. TaxID=1610747 RepID=UPI0035CC4CCB